MGVAAISEFRVEKQPCEAVITLTSGSSLKGRVFLATVSPVLPGRERVSELLNSEGGFFPFEDERGQTVLYNRNHVIMIKVSDNEVRLDSGYGVTRARNVSVLLSNGQRVIGSVRIYRPAGRDRLSDWARDGQRFRYLETGTGTLIINVDHIVAVREATD